MIRWESREQKKHFKAKAEQGSEEVSGPKRNGEGKT